MNKIWWKCLEFWRSESGISSVEYALLLALVGGGIVGGAAALSGAVGAEMTGAANCINGGGASSAC